MDMPDLNNRAEVERWLASHGLHAASPQQARPAQPPGNYFVRHWRGHLTLGKSLLNGILSVALIGPFVAGFVPAFIEGATKHTATPLQMLILAELPAMAISLWGSFGLFRAGWRYQKHAPTLGRRMLGNGAIGAALIGFLGVAANLLVGIAILSDPPAPVVHHQTPRR